jgi:uncharacterized cupin superfamily protein
MSLKKAALDPMSLTPRIACGYPEPYRSRCLPREKRALGDALTAGMCAGFPLGAQDGHCLLTAAGAARLRRVTARVPAAARRLRPRAARRATA